MKNNKLAAVFLLTTGSLLAAGPDYFPLQAGNSWVYRTSLGRTSLVQTIEVTGKQTAGNREYLQVQFFGKDLLVRQADNGSLYAYDNQSSTERLWLPFATAEGERTGSEFDNCSKAATVRSRSAKVTTTLGTFDNALALSYEPSCADAGITSQFFLPYVGMIQQEETTIAGPRRYELIYSRTGSTNLEAGQVSFTMALDAPVYDTKEKSEMLVRLTVHNSLPEPIELAFPSGQRFDLRFWNERGESVYTWSADKLFTAEYRVEKIGPGDRTFSFTAPISQLPPGRYAAEAFLTTNPRSYSSVVHFEVR